MHSDDLFDERVGLHWFVPGPGELLPPRADSGLKSGFDVAVRRLDGLLEVRLVLLDPAHLTADPASAPPQEVAGARCFGYANYRTLDEPTIRLAPSILLKAWNVDGAASGIYSLVGEAPWDTEECLVLVRQRPLRAVRLTKLLRMKGPGAVTAEMWHDWNASMSANLHWGDSR